MKRLPCFAQEDFYVGMSMNSLILVCPSALNKTGLPISADLQKNFCVASLKSLGLQTPHISESQQLCLQNGSQGSSPQPGLLLRVEEILLLNLQRWKLVQTFLLELSSK